MKKIKFLIASMLGAIALVFACVLGTKVNAATLSTVHTLDFKGGSNPTSDYFSVDNYSNSNSCTATNYYSIIDGTLITTKQKGCKMTASTVITFTTTSTSTVNILWGGNATDACMVRFDGVDSTNSATKSTWTSQKYLNVAAGEHTIRRNTGSNQAIVYEVVVTELTSNSNNPYQIDSSRMSSIKTSVGTTALEADIQLDSTLFTAMSGCSMGDCKTTLPNSSKEVQNACINTAGAVSTSQKSVKFTAPADGTLVAYVGTQGESARNIKMIDSNGDEVVAASGSAALDGSTYNPVEITFAVEENETYYLGGDNGVRIYYLSFERTAPAGSSVKALQQEYVNSTDGYTLIRFIFIVSGDTSLNNSSLVNKLTIIKNSGTSSEVSVNKTPNVCNKITNNSATYTAEVSGVDYSFDNSINTNDVYVIYVVKFTTNLYKGNTINASLTYGGSTYTTTAYTFPTE